MVYKITESEYKGFRLVYDEVNNGWICIIGEYEVKFPYSQAANSAIEEILDISEGIIKKHGGKVISKPTRISTTKMVESELPY